MRRAFRMLVIPFVLALTLLAGPPAEAAVPAHAHPASVYGADYAWYRPSDSQLDAASLSFVARYLVPAWRGSGKALTRAEAAALRAQGYMILLNYEWAAGSAQGGYAAGVRDAQAAEVARVEVGAPANLPIYFSVDYDARYGLGTVVSYLNGAASVIGKARVGVYGGYPTVKAALDAGYGYGWQTYAWSSGAWDSRAQVRQIANGAFWGGQGDRDYLVYPDAGFWGGDIASPGVGNGSVNPTAGLSPGTPAAPMQYYRVRKGDTLSTIARNYGTTVARILALNSGIRNANLIYTGQLLRLYGTAVSKPVTSSAYYRVRSGDTLSAIARRYGTTTRHLAAINGIRNPNIIYAGRYIKVR